MTTFRYFFTTEFLSSSPTFAVAQFSGSFLSFHKLFFIPFFSSAVFKPIFSLYRFLVVSVAFLASAMFGVENELKEGITPSIFFYIGCFNYGLSWSYLLCYSATSTTLDVANVGNVVYNSRWYEFPLTVRKSIILILIRSQSPVYFTGFKLIRCTLESFMQVRTLLSFE